MKRVRKTRNDSSGSLRNKVADAVSMPKDLALGVPIITMTGGIELSIENYQGIIEYTEYLIRVGTKSGQIKIVGQRLQIEYFANDEMKVTGRIKCVEFC